MDDEERRGNSSSNQLRNSVFDDAKQSVIECNPDVMAALFEAVTTVGSDGFSRAYQEIHLSGEISAILSAHCMVIEDHAGCTIFDTQQALDRPSSRNQG